MQHQYNLTLIQRKVNNSVIQQRSIDGYINATDLCSVAGKRWHNYVRNETTGHFLRALESKTQIRVSELIQIVRSENGIASTWVHPKVAIHLAQWLSPDFAVQVTEWVYEWMTGQSPSHSVHTNLPAHLHRYLANDGSVPPGYFSILQETALGLIGPLHMMGFDIPDKWVPDISVGKLFCKYLRDEHGVDTDALQTYSHNYLDGRPLVEAKLYPEELLVIYRAWFREIWLPEYGVRYFKRKDINSLPFLEKMPALSAPRTPVSIPRL